MTPENIKYSINVVKLYKLALKGLATAIEQRYTVETFFNEYYKDNWLTDELVKKNATISFNLQKSNIKLVSSLDRAIVLPIKLKTNKGGKDVFSN